MNWTDRFLRSGVAIMTFCLLASATTQAYELYFAPVSGKITSPFGWRTDPMVGGQRFHGGIDIATPTGTPVYATQAGMVMFSGTYGGYGNIVVLNHGNNLFTLYGHNSRLLVSTGQPVYRGQVIALVGSTGRSTGPHLHFEVHYNQQYVNPMNYLTAIQQQNRTVAYASSKFPMIQTLANQQTPTQVQTATTASQTPKKTVRQKRRASVQLVNGTSIQTIKF